MFTNTYPKPKTWGVYLIRHIKHFTPQTYPYDSNMRDRNILNQPRISSLTRDTFGHIKRENYEMSRDLGREIDASEHISNRLSKTAWFIRRTKSSRNKSQGNLSDYTSCSSSSVKFVSQIAIHYVDILPVCNTIPNLKFTYKKNQRVDRQQYVYQELVETSSVQSQNQKYLENRENQYIDMISVPKRFYGQVAYSKHMYL